MIIISECFNNENSSHNAFTCNVELSKGWEVHSPSP